MMRVHAASEIVRGLGVSVLNSSLHIGQIAFLLLACAELLFRNR